MHKLTNGAALPSVAALSYLGDSRQSLFVRRLLIERGLTQAADLNREALKYVTAEAQANACRKIEDLLLDDERAVFKRAQNSTHLNKHFPTIHCKDTVPVSEDRG